MIKKWVQRSLVLVVLLAVIGGFYKYMEESKKVDEGIYYGEVTLNTYDIYATTSGIIDEILVEINDEIEIEQTVMLIDADQVRLQQEKADIGSAIAQANVIKANTGASETDLQVQEHAIAQLEDQKKGIQSTVNGLWQLHKQSIIVSDGFKETYNLQQENYTRIKSLYDEGVESKVSLDNATLAFNNARNAYDSAVLNTEKILQDIDTINHQISGLDEQITAANIQYERMKEGYEAVDKEVAKLNQEMSEVEKDVIALNLDQYQIKAYNNGLIESIYYKKGEFVHAGSPVISLYNPENLLVTIYVTEKDLMSLKLGQSYEFVLARDESIKAEGTITEIASESVFTPVNIVTTEDRERLVFEVTAELAPGTSLKSGMLLKTSLKDGE